MGRIKINVSKCYDVIVENGAINSVAKYLDDICDSKRVAIITDDIVASKYGDIVKKQLNQSGYETSMFVFQNGEMSKNQYVLFDILNFLVEHKIRRNDTLIALGGGVVGDIAGFAAAIYLRGVNIVQIPTTLLAAVDSSVGGKTAIDLENGKNLVGAFWQPSLVVCDPDIIRNLPKDIFTEGLAEVIKCNVIEKLSIFDRIKSGTLMDNIEEIIEQCIILKKQVVESDEYDIKGIRNKLNVGHTVGHAIEKLSDYNISHGFAVGTGMVIEAKISKKLGLCDEDTVELICDIIKQSNLICDIPWSNNELVDAMHLDKKNRDNKIVFELPCDIGCCKEVKLDSSEVLSYLEDI